MPGRIVINFNNPATCHEAGAPATCIFYSLGTGDQFVDMKGVSLEGPGDRLSFWLSALFAFNRPPCGLGR